MMNDETTIVLASANQGKLNELQAMLGDQVRVVAAVDLGVIMPAETEATFAGNAALKSRAAFLQTGYISLADDSGLEVDALNGVPGVFSARYAGDSATDAENNEKLLRAMAEVPTHLRSCRFRSAIAISVDAGAPMIFEGTCEGSLGFTGQGDGGFGYDPLFLRPDGRSFGQMTAAEKNEISHRGQAMTIAVPALLRYLQHKDDQS